MHDLELRATYLRTLIKYVFLATLILFIFLRLNTTYRKCFILEHKDDCLHNPHPPQCQQTLGNIFKMGADINFPDKSKDKLSERVILKKS